MKTTISDQAMKEFLARPGVNDLVNKYVEKGYTKEEAQIILFRKSVISYNISNIRYEDKKGETHFTEHVNYNLAGEKRVLLNPHRPLFTIWLLLMSLVTNPASVLFWFLENKKQFPFNFRDIVSSLKSVREFSAFKSFFQFIEVLSGTELSELNNLARTYLFTYEPALRVFDGVVNHQNKYHIGDYVQVGIYSVGQVYYGKVFYTENNGNVLCTFPNGIMPIGGEDYTVKFDPALLPKEYVEKLDKVDEATLERVIVLRDKAWKKEAALLKKIADDAYMKEGMMLEYKKLEEELNKIKAMPITTKDECKLVQKALTEIQPVIIKTKLIKDLKISLQKAKTEHKDLVEKALEKLKKAETKQSETKSEKTKKDAEKVSNLVKGIKAQGTSEKVRTEQEKVAKEKLAELKSVPVKK
jgi:hypothetical protein